MTTLFSLASKQIWPQVLGFLQLNPRPDRLVLFHTNEETESAIPARRLKELFENQRLMTEASVELVRLPHDHYGKIIDTLAATAERLKLDGSNCRLHFTGGNKLMALAAVEWCRLAETPCFYLERDLRVFPFLPRGNDLQPQEPFKLDSKLANSIGPLALLRCQQANADVVNTGQRLTLSQKGRDLHLDEIRSLLNNDHDFRQFLNWDNREPDNKPGFNLEFATATALLRLGVPVVQRSIRLAPKVLRGTSHLEEGELDLVFNWDGKLWVVDCKNRKSTESKVSELHNKILALCTPDQPLTEMIEKLEREFRERDLHPIKEDLLTMAEVGGLLGKAICIRLAPLPQQAQEFANSRNIPVILRHNLVRDLRSLLFPNEPASLDQLKHLASAKTRATT